MPLGLEAVSERRILQRLKCLPALLFPVTSPKLSVFDLKHGAGVTRAAPVGSAVEIARGIGDHAGIRPISAIAEGVQHSFLPGAKTGWIQLKDSSFVGRSATEGRPVQIALGVKDHAPVEICAIVSTNVEARLAAVGRALEGGRGLRSELRAQGIYHDSC
jgi:hypothetical protein